MVLSRFSNLIVCFTILLGPAASQGTATIPDSLLDHNQDGVIDSKDLLILIHRWGVRGIATSTSTSSPTFTPTATVTFTSTPMSTDTPTSSPSPTRTPSATPSLTDTPTETMTLTPTETATTPISLTVNIAVPLPMKFVKIPAGSFMMGSPETERGRRINEGPVHEVTIAYDFFMGETEVTQKQWTFVMGSNPTPEFKGLGRGDNLPVYNVSWDDIQSFIAILNNLGQGTFRLPSEAEWEYACRAGSSKRFHFGNSLGCDDVCADCEIEQIVIGFKGFDLNFVDPVSESDSPKGPFFRFKRSDFMWYCADSFGQAHSVRLLRPNGFGLYDMSGNIPEFCQDYYHENYNGAPTDGSAWLDPIPSGGRRVYRSGAANSAASNCRSAWRAGALPDLSEINVVGFRLVRDT